MAVNLLGAPKRLLRRRFAREVMTLQAGGFATMGLQFLTSVAIARMLGPDSLGTYTLAVGVLAWTTNLVNLAVGQAMITRLANAQAQGDREESLNLLAYFVKTSFAVALVETVLGLLAGEQLGALAVNSPEIGNLAKILFMSPPLLVFFNMVVTALQSSRQVARLTLLENGALIGTSLLNVTVVALGGGVSGLLWSVALAPAATSAAALRLYGATLPSMGCFPTFREIVLATPRVPLGRYFTFSALVSLDKNFANLLNLIPLSLLGWRATAADAAYFKIASNLMATLAIPLTPIARNLYAKFAELASARDPRRLGAALLKVSLGAGGISVVSSAAMMIVSPFILTLYGKGFEATQAVIYALGIRYALLGFGVVLGPIYQVLDEMKLAIATKIAPAAIMIGAGWFLVAGYGAVGAAVTLVCAYVVGDITNAFLVPHIVRKAARRSNP